MYFCVSHLTAVLRSQVAASVNCCRIIAPIINTNRKCGAKSMHVDLFVQQICRAQTMTNSLRACVNERWKFNGNEKKTTKQCSARRMQGRPLWFYNIRIHAVLNLYVRCIMNFDFPQQQQHPHLKCVTFLVCAHGNYGVNICLLNAYRRKKYFGK